MPLSKVEFELLRQRVAYILVSEVEPIFTPEMMLTLVARHPTNTECYIVTTSDKDLTAVANLVSPDLIADRDRLRQEVADLKAEVAYEEAPKDARNATTAGVTWDTLRNTVGRVIDGQEIRDLRAERDKLREAIRDAGFSVMQTSGKWSIHDVSERAAADENRTAEVISRNIELEAERDKSGQILGNLLAVLNRDGGHRQDQVGVEQAAKEGITEFHRVTEERDRLRAALKRIVDSADSYSYTLSRIANEALNPPDESASDEKGASH